MGKKLIITEKPSVAFDFARVLRVPNSSNRRDGFIENDEYVISWCYGHLVQMVYPEDYDIKYKKWNLEDLPFLPKDYKYGVVESAKEQYFVVNKLLHREDIDTVYWAGDSGKEGQTIEENIRMFGGVRAGMTELRVWIDSQTDDEMLRGINEAKPMSDYALLGKSGVMRTIEDYALGINFSRALSVKYGRMINDAAATTGYTAIALGRVMTCVLGMVVDREREIRGFDETPFYKIKGLFSDVNFPAEWKAVEGSKYFESPLLYGDSGTGFKTKDDALRVISDLEGKEARISSKDISTSKKKAPLLFNLAELQSECSKRFKISPAQTLEIIQDLYEKKYTTYPRTDARVLTSAVAREITKNLNKLQSYGPTADFVKDILSSKKYVGLDKTMYTDDSKVTDHYAVIPTGQCNGIDSLPPLERAVYDMIVRRFLSIFYPPAEYKNVKIGVKVDSESFFAGSKVLVSPGYLSIAGIPKQKSKTEDNSDEDSEEEDDDFSKEKFISFVESASIGDCISANGFKIKEGKTSPPKRYTSGNLILAMENAGKLIEDEELREQIKTTGIGTSATRGEIIDKLIRIGYLNLNNKTQIISPENLGEMIYEVVLLSAPSLLSPEMTASWEKGLEGITNGTVNDADYRNKLEDYIRRETTKMITLDLEKQIAININQFTGKASKGIATRKPLGIKCPSCGGELTTTAFGFGCSNYFNEDVKCKFNIGQIAGIDLSEDEFKQLITDGKTGVIEGFKGKNSKAKFSAIVSLVKDELGQYHTQFDFSESKSEPIEGLKCPTCGGGIVKTSFGYACENRFNEENRCSFLIGEIASRKLSEEELKLLLDDGVTPVLTGFKTKKNSPFNAKLKLTTNEDGQKEIIFDFEGVEAEKLADCKCPDCGGDIYIRPSGYGCGNFNANDTDSCKFFIGRDIAGKTLSPVLAQELIAAGKTATIRGFKGKTGTKFDACLVLKRNEETKRTEAVFDFDNVEQRFLEGIVCPDCGGKLIVRPNGDYSCDNHFNKEINCNFYIGKIAGKSLNAAQVISLITEGHTDTIRDFKGKTGKFDSVLVLKKNDESGKHEIVFDFNQVERRKLDGVKCPDCGGEIIVTQFGFGCGSYNKNDENSCRFVLSNKIAGKTITPAIATELLKNGKTQTLRDFKGKSGKFDAVLVLKKNEEVNRTEAVFDFYKVENRYVENVSCPACGGRIIVTKFGYACEKRFGSEENKCYFTINEIAGKKLSSDDVAELLTNKRTKTIRGFKSKSKKNFDACLILSQNEEEKYEVSFDFENVEAKEIADVVCPICGGKIVVTPFGYGCSNYNKEDPDNSCKFNIGQIAGVKLKENQVKELLKDGLTSVISGFKSKTGKKFDARLTLGRDEAGKVSGIKFVFENTDKELDLKCPKCGEPIIKGYNGFRCKNNVQGNADSCSFFIGKIAGVTLTDEQFEKLIKDRSTDIISGFLSKKGLFFDAKLKLDEENKVVFDFEQFQ